MNFRNSSTVPVLAAALALVFGSTAFAQAKKPARHARTTAPPAATATDAEQTAGAGFGVTESMTGTIQTVVADQNLVVITGPNGVPYDLKVTPKTVIVVGDKRGTIDSLSGLVGKPASVGFVPQRDGNYADRLEVAG